MPWMGDWHFAIGQGSVRMPSWEILTAYIVDPEILPGTGKIPIDAYDSHKDYTDMEIGMRKAMDLGSSQVILLGATGTRLDHTMTNIQCLPILEEAGIRAQIVDQHNRIRLLMGKTVIRKEEQFGRYVSFFLLGEMWKG